MASWINDLHECLECALPVVLTHHQLASPGRATASFVRVIEGLAERPRKRARVSGRVAPASVAVANGVAQPADICRDHGDTAGECLQRREPKPLLTACLYAHVRCLIPRRECGERWNRVARDDS